LGFIRYTVKVILERPWQHDLTYKIAFTILKQQDLNYESPTLRIPVKMEDSKAFLCSVCTTSPLYLSASIPFSGFVPGQACLVAIEINNRTKFDVTDLIVALKKFITYKSQSPKFHSKNDVLVEQEIHCGRIIKNFNSRFNQKLFIPPCPPSNSSSQVLSVFYEIHVTAIMPLFFENIVLKLPIIVGTVPLMFSPNYPTTPGFMSQNLVVPTTSTSTSQTPITEPIQSAISRGDSNEMREFFWGSRALQWICEINFWESKIQISTVTTFLMWVRVPRWKFYFL
jgi:hypothetical protein